jgi:hypothetical protein
MVAFLSPVFILGGTAGALTLTFINSAVSSGASITIPAAALENDIAFLADFSIDGSDNILPSGFTSLANTLAEGDARLRTSYRVLGSSPGGTSVTGMNGATSNAKVMLVFRPSITALSIAVPTWSGEGRSGDPANQTVTASGQTPPLVVIGVAGTTGTPSFNVQTPAFSATVTQGGIIVGYIVYNDTPLNHTVGMADLGSRNVLQSGYIRAVS